MDIYDISIKMSLVVEILTPHPIRRHQADVAGILLEILVDELK